MMNKDQPLLTLYRVTKEIHRRSFAYYEKIGIHHGQPRLLKILNENDGRALSEISSNMRCEMATVSKMVKRMEHAGFVNRRGDSGDSRVTRVFLSEEGRAAVSAVDDIHEEMNKILCRALTDEEKNTFLILLEKILRDILFEENE